MAFTNNVMIVRHGLLAKLVKLWKENRLLEEIDRLPIELSPRKSKVRGRCCVHKERAVWKYKTLPLLGFDMQDEEDELTPLSEYAKRALFRSENKKACKYNKYYYIAEKADAKAKKVRSESREGIRLTPQELKTLDEVLSPLVR